MLEFRYRAEYMLSKPTDENDAESTIAVVTHGGIINQLYRAFFRLPIDSEFAFWTGDTGIHDRKREPLLAKPYEVPFFH